MKIAFMTSLLIAFASIGHAQEETAPAPAPKALCQAYCSVIGFFAFNSTLIRTTGETVAEAAIKLKGACEEKSVELKKAFPLVNDRTAYLAVTNELMTKKLIRKRDFSLDFSKACIGSN